MPIVPIEAIKQHVVSYLVDNAACLTFCIFHILIKTKTRKVFDYFYVLSSILYLLEHSDFVAEIRIMNIPQ